MRSWRRSGALAVLVAAVMAAGALAAARGKVVGPRGAVEVYRAAFHKWKGPLTGDVPLNIGDKVRTGPDGSCTVVFFNREGTQDTVEVAEDTLLEVPDIPENSEETSWVGMFSKAIGKVFCSVTRRPPAEGQRSTFNVRTPTVVAGVRGTEFGVEYRRKKDRTILGVKKGVIDAVMYGGLALGLLTSNHELAIDALKVFRYAAHLRNAQEFLYDNKEKVNAKYNYQFHLAEVVSGQTLIDGQVVDRSWWNRELPWDGRTPEDPMQVKVLGGHAVLHLRNTGWLLFRGGSEFACYREGNALVGRLRSGWMSFWRADPNMGPLERGPAHEVDIFVEKADGGDVRISDYTPKGGVTRVFIERTEAGPEVDVSEGEVKVTPIAYE